MPDQFCQQFFEQNIDFPAEKKLLAKCEQYIEILMKIDPKASQPGDQSLFLATYCTVYVPYDGASATEPIFRSRIECTHAHQYTSIPFIDLRRVRVLHGSTSRSHCIRQSTDKTKQCRAKFKQNIGETKHCPAKYRRKRGKILPQNIEEPRAKLVWL